MVNEIRDTWKNEPWTYKKGGPRNIYDTYSQDHDVYRLQLWYCSSTSIYSAGIYLYEIGETRWCPSSYSAVTAMLYMEEAIALANENRLW